MMNTRPYTSIPDKFKEALSCFTLGLRDALHFRSLLSIICLWVFALIAVGVAFYAFLDRLFKVALEVASMLIMVASALVPHQALAVGVTGGGTVAVTATVWGLGIAGFIVATTYVLLSLLTVRILSEIFMMGWIRKRALSHYPALVGQKASRNAQGSFAREWAGTWGLLLISPACLLLPLVGSVLLFLLLSYLNSRFLMNEALDGIPADVVPAEMSRQLRLELLAIGLISVLAGAIPFLGLLAPWATGAAVCHLNLRRLSAMAKPLPAELRAA